MIVRGKPIIFPPQRPTPEIPTNILYRPFTVPSSSNNENQIYYVQHESSIQSSEQRNGNEKYENESTGFQTSQLPQAVIYSTPPISSHVYHNPTYTDKQYENNNNNNEKA
jgi:hypothetical protein